MTVFLTPDGPALLRRAPTSPTARGGMLAFLDLCRRIDELWRNRRRATRAGRRAHGRAGRTASLDPGDELPGARRARRRLRPAAPAVRHDVGRLRRRPEVPPGDEPRPAAARAAPAPATAVTRAMVDDVARRHGVGRHLRPPRRRLRPLLGRRPLAGAPLREDALRPGPAGPRATCTPGRSPATTATARCSTRPSATCCATCAIPSGGFYSAEDADSEGEEGRFYVWTPDEVRRARRRPTADAAMEWYGVTPGGNFEGANILHRLARGRPGPPAPRSSGRGPRLFAARAERVRPGLDDKVLTEWNAPDARHPGRGGGRHRRRGLAGRRPGQRRVPARASCGATTGAGCDRGRPDGGARAPGLRGRPRRPGRRLRPAGRGHGRGPLDRRGPHHGRRPARRCSGTTSGGGLFTTGSDAERW